MHTLFPFCRRMAWLAWAVVLCGLGACANTPTPQTTLAPVPWRLSASASLNAAQTGQALTVLLRLYALKTPEAFLRAPPSAFGDVAAEQAALGGALLGVHELKLLPDESRLLTDPVPADAAYVGVVALFRSPAPGRWRYAFERQALPDEGVSLGVHTCAMSVHSGQPLGLSVSTARSVALPCP